MTFGIKKIKEDSLKSEPALLLYKLNRAAPLPSARAPPPRVAAASDPPARARRRRMTASFYSIAKAYL